MNAYNPIVNHWLHVWTGPARTIHMNEVKPKSTFPNKGALPKKMREMVRKHINNTPMRSSLCLCPKLLPHPFYHEWASFHAICWKRIKLNLFYLKWLELQAKVNEDFTNTAQRSYSTGSFKNQYWNQTNCPLWPLHRCLNFMSTYRKG